ncbi:MAG: hypothetical protein SCARUB_01666 [Candidatus Scalindua rubra]|uniref:Uncharacterized protein n=1 Tax=Candidatus Scalindua rubra TaxID=1872076 RepID=A0A1E3XC55_9BACT|nr:MAG: hypothetical protein SCARUB_01666 [Candidatus Scalindua rubra]
MAKQSKKQNFENGAFVVSRSIFESDIWQKPPEYLKIWLYLIGKANHKGRKYRGYYCERGQYFCDYKELRDQLKYKIGYRSKIYGDFTPKNLMKYLRSTLMVTTMKKPRGLLITINNYDSYQVLGNYENTSEHSNENPTKTPDEHQSIPSINKNDKELKNLLMRKFEKFWKTYPARNGRKLEKGETLIRFRKLKEDEVPLVLKAVKNYANDPDIKNGIGIRDPKRFLRDGKGNQFWKEWLEVEHESEEKRFDEQGHRFKVL